MDDEVDLETEIQREFEEEERLRNARKVHCQQHFQASYPTLLYSLFQNCCPETVLFTPKIHMSIPLIHVSMWHCTYFKFT